jgi:NADH:ubiquinone oxidoreductase subunit D
MNVACPACSRTADPSADSGTCPQCGADLGPLWRIANLTSDLRADRPGGERRPSTVALARQRARLHVRAPSGRLDEPVLEIDGDTVVRCCAPADDDSGGVEESQWSAGVADRALVVALAAEALLGVEVPARATAIRVVLAELDRLTQHCTWLASLGDHTGALSLVHAGQAAGSATAAITRDIGVAIVIGGVSHDLDDARRDAIRTQVPAITSELLDLAAGVAARRGWSAAVEGVAVVTHSQCASEGITGPTLRATGDATDVRRGAPYLHYAHLDFDVASGEAGDLLARFAVHVAEVRTSTAIVDQVLARLEPGTHRARGRRHGLASRVLGRVPALWPAGEAAAAVETASGRMECSVRADGAHRLRRLDVRDPRTAERRGIAGTLPGRSVTDALALTIEMV